MPDQIKPEITDTAVAPCSAINCVTQKHVAINCTTLATSVSDYVLTSLAPNTRRAYPSDLAHFEHWPSSRDCDGGRRIPGCACDKSERRDARAKACVHLEGS